MNITGRDDLIIAKALHIAAQTLKSEPHPELSDIADMEAILRKRYGRMAEDLKLFDDIKHAARIGVFEDSVNKGPFTADTLRAAIEAHLKTKSGKLKLQ